MDERLRQQIEALGSDAESGASELVARAVGLLERAATEGHRSLAEAARAVCTAQPSMASMWNAAIASLAEETAPGTLVRFAHRLQRSGAALRRVAVAELAPAGGQPLRVATCSFSGSVVAVLADLARACELTVACAEGRPRFEGRRLASALAPAVRGVEFYTDAALSLSLAEAACVVVGADAVTPAWFLNKAGTLPLAAAASLLGVPVFVLATRDKFLPPALFDRLPVREHDAREVWADAPGGVLVRNPYFERVPLHLVAAVVTDAGALGVDMVEEACRANGAAARQEVLDALGLAV